MSMFSNVPHDIVPVSFAAKMIETGGFKILFQDGMALVEDAASYLDGQGREDSKNLTRLTALAYASESMRLTTRLMQLASWLLLQRAVVEGEMTAGQAATEKHRVRILPQQLASSPEVFALLPEKLQSLAQQSLSLQARIVNLDKMVMEAPPEPVPVFAEQGTIQMQMARLQSAFGQRLQTDGQ